MRTWIERDEWWIFWSHCLKWFVLNSRSIDSLIYSFFQGRFMNIRCVSINRLYCVGTKEGWNTISTLKKRFSVVWFWHVLEKVVISGKWAPFYTSLPQSWSILRALEDTTQLLYNFQLKIQKLVQYEEVGLDMKKSFLIIKQVLLWKHIRRPFSRRGLISVWLLFEHRQEIITSQGSLAVFCDSPMHNIFTPHPRGEK